MPGWSSPTQAIAIRTIVIVLPIEPPPPRFILPDPRTAGPDDLIAVGGDLDLGTVMHAYRRGLFPMHLGSGELGWWSPAVRGVIPLDGLRVTRSLARSLRRFSITIDQAFDEVIEGCADPSRPNGWIGPEIITIYRELHRLGWAHSVEAWDRDGELAGGLYGVAINGLFAGESMFHRERDASKVVLVALVERMRYSGMILLDVQWATEHLRTLGAVEVARHDYLDFLEAALAVPGHWSRALESAPEL